MFFVCLRLLLDLVKRISSQPNLEINEVFNYSTLMLKSTFYLIVWYVFSPFPLLLIVKCQKLIFEIQIVNSNIFPIVGVFFLTFLSLNHLEEVAFCSIMNYLLFFIWRMKRVSYTQEMAQSTLKGGLCLRRILAIGKLAHLS